MARAEWALHQTAGAPDTTSDLPSFARLAQEDPVGLTLSLAPGLAVIVSRFPVASLVTAHLYGAPDLDETGRRLRAGRAEQVVVWRQGLRPRIGPIGTGAAALLSALQNDQDLPGALDAAFLAQPPEDGFDFSVWLSQAVTDGLVLGVRDLSDRSPHHHTPQTSETPA